MTDDTDTSEPTPTPVRRRRLATPRQVRCELSRLYWDLRNGRVNVRVAGTGSYVLQAILKSLEVEMFEERIASLEDRAGVSKDGARGARGRLGHVAGHA